MRRVPLSGEKNVGLGAATNKKRGTRGRTGRVELWGGEKNLRSWSFHDRENRPRPTKVLTNRQNHLGKHCLPFKPKDKRKHAVTLLEATSNHGRLALVTKQRTRKGKAWESAREGPGAGHGAQGAKNGESHPRQGSPGVTGPLGDTRPPWATPGDARSRQCLDRQGRGPPERAPPPSVNQSYTP